MRSLIFTAVTASLFAVGCSTSSRTHAGRTSEELPRHAHSSPPLPYMRVVNPHSNTVQLQIAMRRFVPPKHRGPAIWLTGASHIGEPRYYEALQNHLAEQTLVLYEGIGAHAAKKDQEDGKKDFPSNSPAPDPSANFRSTAKDSSLQTTIAESLGLVFQLDAIDYDRSNFRNSDLSIQQLQRLMAETQSGSGKSSQASRDFESLLQIMDGSSVLGSMLQVAVKFIGSSPKLQAMAKLTLIEVLGQLKGDLAQLRGMPPQLKQLVQVLIENRNQKVLGDLKVEIKAIGAGGSISIFYGAGHLDDLEKRIRNELSYEPKEQIWLTAFSVNLAEAGISEQELATIRGLVKWQMEQLQSNAQGIQQ